MKMKLKKNLFYFFSSFQKIWSGGSVKRKIKKTLAIVIQENQWVPTLVCVISKTML